MRVIRWMCVVSLVIVAFNVVGETCSPVQQTDPALVEGIRSFLKVPASVSLEIVDAEPVNGSCYERLMVETVEPTRLRDTTVFLSPDRRFLSHDVTDLSAGATDRSSTAAAALANVPSDSPVLGRPDAKITIVEFSDFECPYCRNAAKLIEGVVDGDPNIRLVFRHLPLAMHPWALYASRASVCAGGERFWKLHDFYFENQKLFTPQNVAEKTTELLTLLPGFDPAAFQSCISSVASLDTVRRDVRAAAKLNVAGTPSVFVNGKSVRLGNSADEVRSQIESIVGHSVRVGRDLTFLVLLRGTGSAVTPEAKAEGDKFVEGLRGEGRVSTLGLASSNDDKRSYQIFMLRADDAAAARAIIARHPLVLRKAVSMEVLNWQPEKDARVGQP
jgi:protein-disulfide isomerase